MKKATGTKSKTTPPIAAPVSEKKTKSVAKAKTTTSKPKAAPAVKAPPFNAPALPTTITAIIDVGFGNSLSLRGDGPGLSWDQGVVMDCVADNQWSLTLEGATAPIVCKFLVNDLSWSAGEDYLVQPGASLTVSPTF
jgi:hypothetical protein